jgi:DNA-binding protein Alba
MAEEKSEAKSEARSESKNEARHSETRPRSRADDNVVFVGKKPTMAYVLAVITQFSEGTKEVHIKARGRSISRAVDVVEVVRNRFVTNVKHSIEIGTEKIQAENNVQLNVSTIDIKLLK